MGNLFRLKNGQFVLLPITDQSRGRGTHSLPAVWKDSLEQLLAGSSGHQDLVGPLRAHDALIDGLASGESLFDAVPVADRGLAHFPAKQNDATLYLTGKVKQADIEIFHLHPDRIDLRERVFGALLRLSSFGLAAGGRNHIDVRAAVDKNTLAERLHLSIDFFHNLLAADSRAQQRLKDRKQRLCFFEGEGSV